MNLQCKLTVLISMISFAGLFFAGCMIRPVFTPTTESTMDYKIIYNNNIQAESNSTSAIQSDSTTESNPTSVIQSDSTVDHTIK